MALTQEELQARLRLARSVVLFVAGLAGIAYETLSTGTERPTLLILFAAMVGLPFAIRTDEKARTPPDRSPKEPRDSESQDA